MDESTSRKAKPSVALRAFWVLLGFALLALAGFMAVIGVGCGVAAREEKSWGLLVVAAGAICVAAACVFWAVRLIVGRRRIGGHLMSRPTRNVLFAVGFAHFVFALLRFPLSWLGWEDAAVGAWVAGVVATLLVALGWEWTRWRRRRRRYRARRRAGS
jgi:hypothetical protein